MCIPCITNEEVLDKVMVKVNHGEEISENKNVQVICTPWALGILEGYFEKVGEIIRLLYIRGTFIEVLNRIKYRCVKPVNGLLTLWGWW